MAELDNIINEPSEAEKRIKTLSGKVETVAGERDAEKSAREAAEALVAKTQRTADFYKGFSDVVSTNPAAKDHRDDILAKVESGYTIEDATYAVLGKAGKLNNTAPVVETVATAGGSAATNLPNNGGTKSVGEMSQDERRAALSEILIVT